MNSAEASNSFSPCALPNRLVDRIQISSGMQRIRANVMELGKFTGGHRALSAGSHKTSVSSIILHGASGKQWTEGQTSALRRLALATRMKARHLTDVLLVRDHSNAGHLLIGHLEGSAKA